MASDETEVSFKYVLGSLARPAIATGQVGRLMHKMSGPSGSVCVT
jgi:hypothetical protein